jgi:hypothetical protein
MHQMAKLRPSTRKKISAVIFLRARHNIDFGRFNVSGKIMELKCSKHLRNCAVGGDKKNETMGQNVILKAYILGKKKSTQMEHSLI